MGTITVIEPSAPQQPTAITGPSGYMAKSNNLSDVANVAAARTNLGLSPSSSIDTTNANNITSGTLSVSRLPYTPANKAGDTFSGPVVIDFSGGHVPVAGVLSPVLRAHGTYSGTPTTTFNYLHNISADSYAVNDTAAGGAYNLLVGSSIDTGQKGNHTVLHGLAVLNTASSNLPADNKFYVGSAGQFIGKVSDHGAGGGTFAGNGFGGNWIANIKGAVGNWNNLVGGEIDLIAELGSTVAYKSGLQIVSDVGDVVQGSASDFGLGFSKAAGAVGFKKLVALSAAAGDWPLSSGGTLIGTEASVLGSPTAYTAAYGVDLRAINFGTASFASNNFQVAGSGTVSASAYNFGGISRNTTVANLIVSDTGNDPGSNDRAKITLQNTAGASSSDSSITFSTNHYGVSSGVRATIDRDGNFSLASGLTYQINGTQVVGARDTGWTAMTGTPNKAATYDTATVTLAQLAGRVAELQAILTAHGLIGA